MFGKDDDGAPEELGNVVLSDLLFRGFQGLFPQGLPGRYLRVGGSAGISSRERQARIQDLQLESTVLRNAL